jgi:hypothetical protein
MPARPGLSKKSLRNFFELTGDVCGHCRKLPARPAKPVDTNALGGTGNERMPCGHIVEGNSEWEVGGFTSAAYGSTSRADETDRTCDPPILPGKTGFFGRLGPAFLV